MNTMPVTTFLIDDSPIWIEAVKGVVERSGRVQVAGWAGSVGEAKVLGPPLNPDVYVVDMRLPDGTGLDFLQHVNMNSNIPVMFLSVEEDDTFALDALKMGGRGYVNKNIRGEDLADLIVKVHQGGYAVSGDVASRALSAARPHPQTQLTARERQIMVLLCSGITSDEAVGTALHISPRTAKTHIAGLRGKLNVPDRAAIVAAAYRNRLVKVESGGGVVAT